MVGARELSVGRAASAALRLAGPVASPVLARYFSALSRGDPLPVKDRMEMPVATQKTDTGLSQGLLKVLHKQVGETHWPARPCFATWALSSPLGKAGSPQKPPVPAGIVRAVSDPVVFGHLVWARETQIAVDGFLFQMQLQERDTKRDLSSLIYS